ncbi:hypothetical protein RchiOBHm_Chr3g0494341 [Rosa chinensis]|uniref:Uncharacterized protein n=1 Tax=Rosa chinensis TaxID=74649 RepID=A0A2P6RGY5_ROSCH|nr:hypothetical protein RchiOBHm_Chr3g0494341 [Rosa chinensis]
MPTRGREQEACCCSYQGEKRRQILCQRKILILHEGCIIRRAGG